MKKFALLVLIHSRLMALPLWFEPNQGQAHHSVQFLSRGVYLGSNQAAIQIDGTEPVVMTLAGARPTARAEGLDAQPGITSYFLGNDPKKWHSGVPHYARVLYNNVYPGIDLVYYHNAEGRLEYDFVVQPGADTRAIQLSYNHRVVTASNGDLLIAGIRQKRPRVFQDGREIACTYRIQQNNHVQLAIATYDHSQPLTVDPVLEYSTYLGGPAFEQGTGIRVDSNGFMYVSMWERAPSDPTLNPFQQTSSVGYAAFVVKFTPDGQGIVYVAYLGGTGDTFTDALAVDKAGNTYVTGTTSVLDLPVKNAFQPQFGGGNSDAFAVKFSADGRSIVYATYLGGSGDDGAGAIALDASGAVTVGGQTYSLDFPTHSPLQQYYGGGGDGFITRLAPDGKSLEFSTFLGGSGLDALHGLALDSSGFIYLTGFTSSINFPLKNAFQPSFTAPSSFVTKLTPLADAIVYSTFLGGTGAFSIAVDASGSAYVSGVTSGGLTTKNAFQPTYGGQSDIFVARLNAAGSDLVFSTYFGGSDTDYQNSNTLALDSAGNVYVTGFTYSSDFPLKDSIQSFIGATTGYRTDAFVLMFTPSGSLVYSTLIGGHGEDGGGAITVDSSGTVYVTGDTYSDDFPLKNPFQSTYGGAGDAFVLKFAPNVAPPSPFSPTPGTVQFTFVMGGSAPAAQTISIPSGGPFSITTSNAPWASVSPQSGNTPGTLTISVNPNGLAPEVYSGTIQIMPPSGTPFTLPVTLNVLAPAPVVTSIVPSIVALNSGQATFIVTGSGFTSASIIKFQASTELATTFIDSGTLQFSLPKNFFTAVGTYSVNVSNPQTALSAPLTFTVGSPPPVFVGTAVVNAASYASGSVAPGEIVTVFGTNLGTAGNASVTFDGVPATLVYVAAMQVAATVPYSVGGGQMTSMVITSNAVASTPVSLNVTASAPGIFTSDASGMGQAAALNQDNTVNGASNPAAAGSVVALYGTGGGALTTDPLPRLTLPVSATVGGLPAQIFYAGIAPGLVQGAMQVNVQIPSGVTPGAAVPVAVMVGNALSNPVTLAIQ